MPAGLREDDQQVWRRHPGDVARLVFRLGALLIILAITALLPSALRNASADLVRLFARTPSTLRDVLVGIGQLMTLLIPVLVVAWLLLRRSVIEATLVVGAAVVGGLLMSQLVDWLDRAAPPQVIEDLPSDWITGLDFPSASYLTALVAGAAVASPMMTESWRRASFAGVGAAVLVRLLTAVQTPVNMAVTVALGAVVGSAVLVAFGSPRRRPGAAMLRAELATGGLDATDLRDESSHTGRRTYLGRADDRDIRVAYLDRDDRDADFLAQFIRALRVQSVDDEMLSTRPRQRVEHEALATMMAARSGASVPSVLAVVPSSRESALIALDVVEGTPLSLLEAGEVDDEGLDDLWRQLADLHAERIAHRWLVGDHLVLDGDRASLVGLENARLAASDDQLAVDTAEMLVGTALIVGSERAIAAATRVMSAADLEAALPFIQPAALPADTRRAIKADQGLPDELRLALQQELGVDEVEIPSLERITVARVVTWVGFAILAFFLLTLVSSWSEIAEAMKGIDWAWVGPIAVASILITVGGALALMGSVLRRIPLGESTLIMYGQSFLNRFTPANAGGMAMRIRYLQKGGTDVTVATAAVGLTSAVSGVLQAVVFGFFVLWSGDNPTDSVVSGESGGPDGTIVAVLVVSVIVATIVVVATPKLRTWIVDFVRSTRSKIRHDFGELARRPSNLAELFGGTLLAKLATIVAFVMSCRAFDIDLGFAELGVLYLGATTIASAVPTPGGVGAIEAALILVLTSNGVSEATAWAAVLLFRLLTYWIPTIPAYVAFKVSEHRQLI